MSLEDHLLTESQNSRSEAIDALDARAIVALMNAEDAVVVEALSKRYPGRRGAEVPAVDSIGFTVPRGATVGLLGGMQFLMLGIIGAYLGRLYDQSKGRPLFMIRDIVGGQIEAPK